MYWLISTGYQSLCEKVNFIVTMPLCTYQYKAREEGGGGCRQGWGFVSVTPNFVKRPWVGGRKIVKLSSRSPPREHKIHQKQITKSRYHGEISGHDIIRSLYESVVLHRDTSILKVYDTKFANLPRYK